MINWGFKRLKIILVLEAKGWKRLPKFRCVREETSSLVRLFAVRFHNSIWMNTKLLVYNLNQSSKRNISMNDLFAWKIPEECQTAITDAILWLVSYCNNEEYLSFNSAAVKIHKIVGTRWLSTLLPVEHNILL